MAKGQRDRDETGRSSHFLRSVIDPNDFDGTKNRVIDQIHRRALVRELPKSGKLLDFGCGTGRMARPVSRRGLDYTGADTSSSMIEAAQDANEGSAAKFVHLGEGPMPFAPAEFDVVMTVMVYQYIVGGPDNASFVSELRRVIRSPGRLIMIEQASLSGQQSGTVQRTTTPDDYKKALYPHFQVDKISYIRSSEFSNATRRLFAIAKRCNLAKAIVVPFVTTIEYEKSKLHSDSYLRSIPYFDVVLSAVSLP
jgi:ubiquinone/menaquinone biosynthesis C-methylase UbiE